MKNKKLLSGMLALAIASPLAVVLAGCGNGGLDVNAKDVYAMSAVSGANYLMEMETKTSLNHLLEATAQTRPESIKEAEVTGIKDCLTMFDSVIANGGINQDTNKNTESDRADYTFKMQVTIPGTSEKFIMYYNETETETNTEIEDEKEEVEVSTKLEGIMVAGEIEFDVFGERNFEQEGNETEAEITFTTKSKTNPENYVTVTQSVENDEIEYEYKIYENGVKVKDTEVEIENEDGKDFELEFELVDLKNQVNTRYTIKKSSDINYDFVVEYMISGQKNIINVNKTAEGYTFNYDNGFTENV